MKVRSVGEFEDVVAAEYSWRRKELTNIRATALSSRKSTKTLLLRCAIPIVYAHWEGFVRQASVAKLSLIVSKGIKYSELSVSFRTFAILEHYKGNFPGDRFVRLCELVDDSINYDSSFKIDPEKYVNARSNLNYEVLRDIAAKADVDVSSLELKRNFIDESFVGLRNKICHGERVIVSEDDLNDIYFGVADMISIYRNEILNSVCTESYLVP